MNKKTELPLTKTSLKILSAKEQCQIKGGGCCEDKRPPIVGKPGQITILVINSTIKVIKP